jgi:hypothetical protein
MEKNSNVFIELGNITTLIRIRHLTFERSRNNGANDLLYKIRRYLNINILLLLLM